MAAVAYPIVGSTPADQAIGPSTNPVKYMGFSVRETAGATAVFRIRVASASGKILDTVALAANESAREWYGPMGKQSDGQLFLDAVSGDFEGSVFLF